MIEPFIITFWVELHGRLYHKRLSRSFNDCEAIVEKLYKEFEDKEEKLPSWIIAINTICLDDPEGIYDEANHK